MRESAGRLSLSITAALLLTCLLPLPADSDDTVFPSTVLHAGGGAIGVEFDAGDMRVSHDDVLRWIGAAAKAVSHYYGRYPVDQVLIRVKARSGRGDDTGTTYGDEDG